MKNCYIYLDFWLIRARGGIKRPKTIKYLHVVAVGINFQSEHGGASHLPMPSLKPTTFFNYTHWKMTG
jgi:hypothetical protein